MITPGTILEIPGKNPDRTGNTATRFVVTGASLAYNLDVEYADGQNKGRKTSFIIEKSRAEGFVVNKDSAESYEAKLGDLAMTSDEIIQGIVKLLSDLNDYIRDADDMADYEQVQGLDLAIGLVENLIEECRVGRQ